MTGAISIQMGPEEAAERYWPRVEKRGPDDCWLWLGCSTRGYGVLSVNTRQSRASHVALVLSGRPRPSPMHGACHTCDNPPCVNPAHLWWGTQVENTKDAYDKGRQIPKRGSANANAKLTPEQVVAAREAYRQVRNIAEIARRFGISRTSAFDLLHGRTYVAEARP